LREPRLREVQWLAIKTRSAFHQCVNVHKSAYVEVSNQFQDPVNFSLWEGGPGAV